MIKNCIKRTREYYKHKAKMNEGFNFQSRLRELMNEMNIQSNYELAQRCNVDRATVTRWMKDDHVITLKTLQKICDGLGITFRDFFPKEEVERRGDGISCLLREKWKTLKTDIQKKAFLEFGEIGAEKVESFVEEFNNSSLS